MRDLLARVVRAARRRPVRVLEAVLALAAALGVAIGPELVGSAEAVIGVLAAVGVVGGEAAQLRTESREHGAEREQRAWHEGRAEGARGTTTDQADQPDATTDPLSGKGPETAVPDPLYAEGG